MTWLAWSIMAVVCWGVWALIARLVGDAISPAQSQALSTIGLLPVIVLLFFSTRKQEQRGSKLSGVALGFAAGVLTCIGNIAYYYLLNSGAKAATVVPLTALYPLVTVLLALLFLHERLNRLQLAGVCLSLVAIYTFNIQREEGLLSRSVLLALLPIMFWGVSGFVQKLSTNHVSGEVSAISFLGAFVPIAIILWAREPMPNALPSRIWLLSAALGFSFALGNFAILQAFANNGKASVIAPLAGLYPLVSVPIAIVAFREKVGVRETIGIVTALVAIIALSLETRQPTPQLSRT
jgi:drug/metabolite transporter (DMT)-like permease